MHTVLIVDDRSDIRRLLHVTLGRDYRIVEAENGTSALEAVRLHQPGLVLLDVMMPGEVNGMQVLEAIKSNPQTRTTWVALLSARNQPADQEEARARGADAYFIKPFSPPQVVAWVRSKLK